MLRGMEAMTPVEPRRLAKAGQVNDRLGYSNNSVAKKLTVWHMQYALTKKADLSGGIAVSPVAQSH
jgi:hypothetical protein